MWILHWIILKIRIQRVLSIAKPLVLMQNELNRVKWLSQIFRLTFSRWPCQRSIVINLTNEIVINPSLLCCFLFSDSWVLWSTPWHKAYCFPEKATIIKDNNTFLWLQQAPVTIDSSLLIFLHRFENILLLFLFKFLSFVSFSLTAASFFHY